MESHPKFTTQILKSQQFEESFRTLRAKFDYLVCANVLRVKEAGVDLVRGEEFSRLVVKQTGVLELSKSTGENGMIEVSEFVFDSIENLKKKLIKISKYIREWEVIPEQPNILFWVEPYPDFTLISLDMDVRHVSLSITIDHTELSKFCQQLEDLARAFDN